MIYIIDTYAWVEYFRGSDRGSILKKLFEDKKSKFVTMECCLSELLGFCLKNSIDFEEIYKVLKRSSIILPVLRELWLRAAKIRFEKRKKVMDFGLIDSILLAKQQELKCKVVSGDTHFKEIKNVIYMG